MTLRSYVGLDFSCEVCASEQTRRSKREKKSGIREDRCGEAKWKLATDSLRNETRVSRSIRSLLLSFSRENGKLNEQKTAGESFSLPTRCISVTSVNSNKGQCVTVSARLSREIRD